MSTAIITQARMTSSRLPGKVMMEIHGKPLLDYHINRLQDSGLQIIVATSVNKTDQPIEDLCVKNKIHCFRGDEKNVLSRYYEAAKTFDLKTIIRVTSDCPLIDGALIAEGYEVYNKKDDQQLFLSNTIERTFPRGFDFAIFSFQMLEDAFLHATSDHEREHVTPYIRNNTSGTIQFENYACQTDNSDLRLTVDEQADFNLINTLISDHHADRMTHQEIVDLLRSNKGLASMNSLVRQKE